MKSSVLVIEGMLYDWVCSHHSRSSRSADDSGGCWCGRGERHSLGGAGNLYRSGGEILL